MRRGAGAAAPLILAAFFLIYAPDVGHGFITDDFGWLLSAQEWLRSPSAAGLMKTAGFFRPIVSLSFAVQAPLFGHHAFGYGVTNLLLVVLCAALVYRVCREQHLGRFAGYTSAASWMFNFHGINMSVLWISGRTSLLLTLFALLAAWAALRKQRWWTALSCTAALLSKEEAVALPFILGGWVGLRTVWPSFVALAGYLMVRLHTNALWLTDAPDYYRFTIDPAVVLTNTVHYIDRASTAFVIVAVVLMLLTRRRLRLDGVRRDVIMRGLLWFAGGYAITLWLPVRSSLYAVFPSVGIALVLAALLERFFAALDERLRTRVAIILLVLPFVLIPVFRGRNVRWVELADLSRQVMADLEPHAPTLRARTPLWIVDDTSTRANIHNAFAAQLNTPIQLFFAARPEVHITIDEREVPTKGALVLRLRDGRLR